jgi:hypothetical protein
MLAHRIGSKSSLYSDLVAEEGEEKVAIAGAETGGGIGRTENLP